MKIKIFILRFKCYYSKTNHVVNKQCEYGVHVTNSYICSIVGGFRPFFLRGARGSKVHEGEQGGVRCMRGSKGVRMTS